MANLSGGERNRLQMALLMLSEVHFLMLDEPTNKLDIPSAEVLEGALSEFEGSMLIISADRYFLDRVVDRVVELDEGALTEYLVGYSDCHCHHDFTSGHLREWGGLSPASGRPGHELAPATCLNSHGMGGRGRAKIAKRNKLGQFTR